MTHTPGPWKISEMQSHVVTGPHSNAIAKCYISGECANLEQADANARLIAAAPELLEALQNLTATARTFRNVPKDQQEWTATDDAALDEAFAAIQKATGDTYVDLDNPAWDILEKGLTPEL